MNIKKITLFSLLIILLSFGSYKLSNEIFYEVIEIQGDFAMDVTQREEVVGNSENVFVAKVIEQVGSYSPREGMAQTRFKVEVIKNIKGKLKKGQTINQNAGFVEKDGEKYLVKYENQELLEPGKLYLFASLYDVNNKWHNPVPGYGEIPIESTKESEALAKSFAEAFKNQKISGLMKKHVELNLVNGHVEE